MWNGLTDRWHLTQMLADMLTMQDHAAKPLIRVRICAPEALWPDAVVQDTAWDLAARSGVHLTVTDSVRFAVSEADFLYTDVWVSMGEAASEWEERVSLLLRQHQLVSTHGNGPQVGCRPWRARPTRRCPARTLSTSSAPDPGHDRYWLVQALSPAVLLAGGAGTTVKP